MIQLAELQELQLAQMHSLNHRAEIEASDLCGCFHCVGTFRPNEITYWTDCWTDSPDEMLEGEADQDGDTAVCPYCGIDAVIGSAGGFPITPEFLNAMNVYWIQ